MKYIVSYKQSHQRFIDIECIVDNLSGDTVRFQLPAWRPGRYELGNFAKNIQRWEVFNENGEALPFRKLSKDSWEVQLKGAETIHVHYNYYACQADAGGCWLDEEQLYINGIHCFLYVVEKLHESCEVELVVPENYKVATGMRKLSEHLLKADNFDYLVDSPFIASASIQHNSFELKGTHFNLWFQGECKPQWSKIIGDFLRFAEEQLMTMKRFPFDTYHFLFQVWPYAFYHGVEHMNSTVIALGPGYDLMKDRLYKELLGVSSHELFHVWNVKKIRPVEMMPYDYTKENYTRLGFVSEGVTTYYGDLFLLRSGVFSVNEYFEELNKYLQKHFDNFGRFNLSVADSSFDTWLDGYTQGIPDRKTSIYTEGCLCALMTDLLIRKYTDNKKSLDNAMRLLYNDFALKGIGYSEKDYRQVVENIADTSFENFFRNYVYGTVSYEEMLKETLDYAGCELIILPTGNGYEERYGFKVALVAGKTKVIAFVPGSPADRAGLAKDNEIVAVNDMKVINDNFKDWCDYFDQEPIELSVFSGQKLKKISLVAVGQKYYPQYKVRKQEKVSEMQKIFFKEWSKQVF